MKFAGKHQNGKMRLLFLIFAKLLGLLQLFWALTVFSYIGLFFMMFSPSELSSFGHIPAKLIVVLVYLVLVFGLAWFLLARTEWGSGKLMVTQPNNIVPTFFMPRSRRNPSPTSQFTPPNPTPRECSG